MTEPLIVGIDPGSTSAIAALNLEGELKLLESDREFPQHRMIRRIVDTGKPVVVACDTEKIPSTVEKVASSLGAEKFRPDEDLESEWKKSMSKGENSHEKDAYASALHAYNNLQREIKKINDFVEKEEVEKQEAAEKYFNGEFNKLKQS